MGVDNDSEGSRCKERVQDIMLTLSFFGGKWNVFLSGNVLLAVVSMIAFAPATAFAANDPAANQVVETIHFNQATAEKLQSLAGVGPALL